MKRVIGFHGSGVCALLACAGFLVAPRLNAEATYSEDVIPFLTTYCAKCHGGEKTKGGVNFVEMESQESAKADFETWEIAVELLREGEMPPDAAEKPNLTELETVFDWYQETFIDSIEPRPAPIRSRRLSSREYRNSLRDLLGFDLEIAIIEAEQTQAETSLVLKLLPTDPPGKSGFKNDTHGAALSNVLWDQYAYISDVAIESLFDAKNQKYLESYVDAIPDDGTLTRENAIQLMRGFLRKAYRRPVPNPILERALKTIRTAVDPSEAARAVMRAALMSPQFLYRGFWAEPKDARSNRETGEVDDFEFAERLSYFLWGSFPDSTLWEAVGSDSLRTSTRSQIERMLQDPKAKSFYEDFATQWLALDAMDELAKRQLPLAVALKSQPVEFLEYLIVENRPILELIDSKVTFANPLIANFYRNDRQQIAEYRKEKGIELEIVPHTRIHLENTPERGGLLTMPGILAMNRGPILRGVWILERVLGTHLPDPPPNVGQVEPNIPGEDLTFRERFEQHRENPSCAHCHNRIDPIGFALERYDNRGDYIRSDEASEKIDTTGRLPNGAEFADFNGLKAILLKEERDAIIRNCVERLLAYALCRELEIHDQPTVREITNHISETNGGWKDLIFEIVSSLPFQEALFTKDPS